MYLLRRFNSIFIYNSFSALLLSPPSALPILVSGPGPLPAQLHSHRSFIRSLCFYVLVSRLEFDLNTFPDGLGSVPPAL